jgi:hypothetical protein
MHSSDLINEHLKDLRVRIEAHNLSFLMYRKWDKYISLPILLLMTILSSTMGILVFSDGSGTVGKWLGLILSTSALTLTALKGHLQWDLKAHDQDTSSKLFKQLLRSVEVKLISTTLTNDDKHELFRDIISQISIIEQYEEPIPKTIEDKIVESKEVTNEDLINNILQIEKKFEDDKKYPMIKLKHGDLERIKSSKVLTSNVKNALLGIDDSPGTNPSSIKSKISIKKSSRTIKNDNVINDDSGDDSGVKDIEDPASQVYISNSSPKKHKQLTVGHVRMGTNDSPLSIFRTLSRRTLNDSDSTLGGSISTESLGS